MDYESPWQEILLEASLALPVQLPPPGFEVYKEAESDQKAWRNQQAFDHFSAARPGSSRSSNIAETDKKGQEMEAAIDQVARKRMNDRTYRERCKKNKMETERNLELLSKENDRLKGENASLKRKQHDKQNTLVEVLSERLAGAKDGDLQRENTQLKSNIALLRSQVNDRNNLDKLQLQEKNAQLEHEKRSLEMIVQALCEKISNEKGADEGDLAG
ncbi:hypothetical protein OIU85_025224 [Salix viminalis]|uniref:Uncharacterized protein n=1 Tax=Salix viminalis TaxID=40686 RepID=A0A9Q0YXC5_SALVM|nr:hypothetical protein OIU85_025224 [Salix viminalis]